MVDLSYGQVVFTPRHDHFIQAKYTEKLPFGKKSISPLPVVEGFHVVGAAPLPQEYLQHIKSFLKSHPELRSVYSHLLDLAFDKYDNSNG